MKSILLSAVGMLAVIAAFAQRPAPNRATGPLPPNEATISVEGDVRTIRSNGIPDHKPGDFPRRGNPNAISAQAYVFKMTTKPVQAAERTDARRAWFGVALNGVPLEAGTAEFWNGMREWNYEAMSGKIDLGLDEHHAHVQPTGAYHYHGLPVGFIKAHDAGGKKMLLVGYAADGFPIYTQWGHADAKDAKSALRKMQPGWKLKSGERPMRPDSPGGKYDGTFTADYEFGGGDLDEANGRVGVTPEYPEGIYHYYITEEFPFLPRFWRGTPDESFFKRGLGPGAGPGGPPGGPGGRRGNRPFPPPPPPDRGPPPR